MMMETGEYVKAPIEISPTMNGGYIIRRQVGQYQMQAVDQMLAFSNHVDLLKFLMEELPAAHRHNANEGGGE